MDTRQLVKSEFVKLRRISLHPLLIREEHLKAWNEPSHHGRDYLLVHRDQFLINFDKWGLNPRLRHYISSFTKVFNNKDFILKSVSIECYSLWVLLLWIFTPLLDAHGRSHMSQRCDQSWTYLLLRISNSLTRDGYTLLRDSHELWAELKPDHLIKYEWTVIGTLQSKICSTVKWSRFLHLVWWIFSPFSVRKQWLHPGYLQTYVHALLASCIDIGETVSCWRTYITFVFGIDIIMSASLSEPLEITVTLAVLLEMPSSSRTSTSARSSAYPRVWIMVSASGTPFPGSVSCLLRMSSSDRMK